MLHVVLCAALVFLGPESVVAASGETTTDTGVTENPINSGKWSETNQLLEALDGNEVMIIKSKILLDLQQQISNQSEIIERSSAQQDKMADDIRFLRETIDSFASEGLVRQTAYLEQIKILVSSAISESNSKNQQSLINISTAVQDVANRTKQISSDLLIHDQRLQNFTKGASNITSTSTTTPIISSTPASTLTSTTTSTLTSVSISRDCSDIKKTGATANGVYRIYLTNGTAINVYCDFNTSNDAWLVIQRRKDGSVNFNQTWTAYKDGFGSPGGELYLGNDAIYQLTSSRKCKLRIDLEGFDGVKKYATYATFSIASISDYYRVSIGTFSGDVGDSFSYHNGQQFSTFETDRDSYVEESCASYYAGGWWFNRCLYSNLNGKYHAVGNPYNEYNTVYWVDMQQTYRSLKAASMKIAPVL